MEAEKTVKVFSTVYECAVFILSIEKAWTEEMEKKLIEHGVYSGKTYTVFYDDSHLLD